MVDKRLLNFAKIIQDLDNPKYEGVERTQLLHPATRSWITGEYPENPTSWPDEQWHVIWRLTQHKALEFHTDLVSRAERNDIDLDDIENESYTEDDFALWTMWFELEFNAESVKGKGILQEENN